MKNKKKIRQQFIISALTVSVILPTFTPLCYATDNSTFIIKDKIEEKVVLDDSDNAIFIENKKELEKEDGVLGKRKEVLPETKTEFIEEEIENLNKNEKEKEIKENNEENNKEEQEDIDTESPEEVGEFIEKSEMRELESTPRLISYYGNESNIIDKEDFYFEGNTLVCLNREGREKLQNNNITTVIIPRFTDKGKEVLKIGDNALAGVDDRNLTGALIFEDNNHIKEISSGAFVGNNLDSIDMSNCNYLQKIGDYAFAHAGKGETLLIMPPNVDSIGDYAFSNSAMEFTITITYIKEYKKKYENGINENRSEIVNTVQKTKRFTENSSQGYCSGIENLIINARKIGKNAFSDNLFENALEIGQDIEWIDNYAFSNNDFKGQLNIADCPISYIGDYAFLNAGFCDDLNLTNLNNLEYIGKGAFQNTSFKGSLILTNIKKIEVIPEECFFNNGKANGEFCEQFFNGMLIIEDLPNLKKISKRAFSHNIEEREEGEDYIADYDKVINSDIEAGFSDKLVIKGCPNLEIIDEYAFMDNRFEGGLDLSDCKNLRIIGKQSFSNANFNGNLDLHGLTNLEEISNAAFFATQFKSINLNDLQSLKIIDKMAFTGVPFESDLEIKDLPKLEKIGESAFQYAGKADKALNVIIQNNEMLKTIENYAFLEHNFSGALILVDLPVLTKIGNSAFSINPDDSIDYLNNTKDKKMGFTDLKIKNLNELKVINKQSFSNNRIKGTLNLSSLKKLEEIGECAFARNGFTCVELPSTVKAVRGLNLQIENGTVTPAFYFNNKNYEGIIVEELDEDTQEMEEFFTDEYFDLPLVIKDINGKNRATTDIKTNENTEDDYQIMTTGSCEERGSITVKIVDENNNVNEAFKNAKIVLYKNDEVEVASIQNDVANFNELDILGASYKALISGIESDKFDLSKVNTYHKVPEFKDGMATLVVKVPYKKSDVTIRYLDFDTKKAIKEPEVISKTNVGDKVTVSIPSIENYNLYKILVNGEDKDLSELGFDFTVPGKNTEIIVYYKDNNKKLTIRKIDEKTKIPMPCIIFGIFDAEKYNNNESDALIEKVTTNAEGEAYIKYDRNIVVVELGIDYDCDMCSEEGCFADYDNYVPNKKIVEVNHERAEKDSVIDFTGNTVTITVPHTGTRGLLPYLGVALIVIIAGIVIKKSKKDKND